MNAPPQSATGFWSIERFVAFVLGPVVTAGSGWLSLLLAKKFGIHIDGAEITGIFATGGLSASALAYKWLHGRQVESKVAPVLTTIENNPITSGFAHTALHELESLAQNAAQKAVQAIQPHATSPPPPPIPAPASDPAPAGMADAGAAAEA